MLWALRGNGHAGQAGPLATSENENDGESRLITLLR